MSEEKKSPKKNAVKNYRKKFIATDEKKSFSHWARAWESESFISNILFGDQFERFRLGRIFFCFAFSFVFSFLLTFELNLNPSVKLGEVASRTIRAPFDFAVVDRSATKASQEKAVELVPVVLDYYPGIYDKSLEGIRKAFAEMREQKKLSAGLSEAGFIDNNLKNFDALVGVETSQRAFKWLFRKDFSFEVEAAVLRTVEDWSASYLVNKNDLSEGLENNYALVRTINPSGDVLGEEQKLNLNAIKQIVSYSQIDKSNIKGDFTKYDEKRLEEFLRPLRKANIKVSLSEYSKRKSEAKNKVLPVVISIKQNQVILKEGSLIQEQDVLLVSEVLRLKSSLRKRSKALILALLLTVILAVGISFLKKRFELNIARTTQDFLVLFAIGFVSLVVIKVSIFLFEGALFQKFGSDLPTQVIFVLAPFAMMTMLAALLVRTRALLWLFIIYSSVGLSFLASDSFSYLLVALVGGMASVRAFSVCRSRRDFYFAGFVSGLVIGIFASIVYIFKLETFSAGLFTDVLLIFSASVIGGLLSSIFAVTLVPLFESFFDVLTDLKLLELSNLSHPLLKEMMVKAPGTYHHCMVVGSMVEAACNEIGVNGLLGKVMAYFHDVGKMEHAEYFVENQKKGFNPHDNISPYLSKTIIIAHVKDGVELVLKHKLGKAIVAGVKEHHGTTMIKYFYNKALSQADNPESVKEGEFRYPGPKPQFKESAILMLADSIEAAARTLDEPSPLRIQNLIESMVDSKFSDGQMDECHITFAELTRIKAVFYKVLIGVYHHRVEYPKEIKQNLTSTKISKDTRTLPLEKK